MNTEILTLIIRLAVAFAVSIVFPALKKWIDQKTENEKYSQLREAAETAVYAAEQMKNVFDKADPEGTERKRYAMLAVQRTANRLGLAITDHECEEIIEAAVCELNLFTKKEIS